LSKVRVYEVAKKLGVSSREVIWGLGQIGVQVKNHMSSVDEPVAEKVIDFLSNLGKKPREEQEPVEVPTVQPAPKQHGERAKKTTSTRTGRAPTQEKKEGRKEVKKEERRKRPARMADRKAETKARPFRPKKGVQQPEPGGSISFERNPTVRELAQKLGLTPNETIKQLISLGVMVSLNQEVDIETASILATELGFTVEERKKESPTEEVDILEKLEREEDQQEDPGLLRPRPPVVTVLGHVDHGKTSLLDAIRETKVTATEAGGITQHIGAYMVEFDGKKIVFLDTPGHEAFTAMRARGAQVTDLVVLVVAADDGVMPQTVEAINHAKAAGVPIIVAINKIDKPGANPEQVKQQLVDHQLVPEEWGGDTVYVSVSALKRQGLEDLLEMILLVAQMQELKANPDRLARGTVIEARLDKGRGPVATILVQKGTLRVGDAFVIGSTYGKVRAMLDDRGRRVKAAGPSTPIEVLGISDVPEAGDSLVVVESEKEAREIAEARARRKRETDLKAHERPFLDDLFERMKEGDVKELKLVVKGDVHGSVEAICQSLERLDLGEVKVNVIHGGVGAINESDVMLAAASDAIVVGFNVRPDPGARKNADREGVEIRTYRVIYEAIEDIRAAMKGMLAPKFKEMVIGRAEVRATFKVPKVGVIAGSYVTDGKVTNKAKVRILRDGIVIHEGRVGSLKRFKDDVKEVASGYECGIGVENYNDLKEGDILEFYITKEVA